MKTENQISFKADKNWKPYLVNLSLIVVIFLMGIFLGFIVRTNQIFESQFLTTARAHFKNIVLTRRWNANYGGVFVRKTEGVISNPYLENPDITDTNGQDYTKKNPAMMTREISEYAESAGDFKFHITSLKPLNPDNKADSFEKMALSSFENGVREQSCQVEDAEKTVFRYMAPLYVEKACLACHAKQGYRIGDVRGGISVSFDISDIKAAMSMNKLVIAGLSIAITLLLLAIIYVLTVRLSQKLSLAYSTIEKMSITDELTQLNNRRYFHDRLDHEVSRSRRHNHLVALIILDIDHFKLVNDTHGHQAGDLVLVEVAKTLKDVCRKTDITARYGGEEMAVILPETGLNGAEAAAEKIRKAMECRDFELGDGKSVNITISLGISSLAPGKSLGQNEGNLLIKWADEALYQAKNEGRNRVKVSKCDL